MKKFASLAFTILSVGAIVGTFFVNASNTVFISNDAAENIYKMNFNASTRLTDHYNNMYSNSNYPIHFSCNGSLLSYENGWQILNGSLNNDGAIKGMKTITINYTGNLTISYGYMSNNHIYYIVSEPITSGFIYNFDNSKPSYFKLVSAGDAFITSMQIAYSCIDNNPTIEQWGRENMGVVPSLNGSTITYGMYPDNRISDNAIINSLENSSPKNNGMYFLDGKYYLNREADPRSSSEKFDDGTYIVKGNVYWFECHPIIWDVLSVSGNTYKLFSKKCLDSNRFHHTTSNEIDNEITYYPSNYFHSDMRSFLNGVFYYRAFSLSASHIQNVKISNETVNPSDEYINTPGIETFDYVYLLSYQELSNEEYGFIDNNSRKRAGTDYAASYSGTYRGFYLTRTPCGSGQGYMYGTNYMRYVSSSGGLTTACTVTSYYGVCPGITITL